VKADALDNNALSGILKGKDAVISTFGIDFHKPKTFHLFSDAMNSIIHATKKVGVKRLINVGVAGSLEIGPAYR